MGRGRRDWIPTRVGAAAIATAIFAVGGAHRWSQAIVAIVSAIALAGLVRSRRVFARTSPLIVMLVIAIGLTAIQVIPLPHAIVDALSPTQTGLRDDGLALVGAAARSTITADVPATLRALIFFVILLAIAIIALRLAISEQGRYQILATIALLCGGAALVGDLHNLFGLQKLYGLIAPQQLPRVLGPMFNSNHYACLMAIGAAVACGLLMYQRQRSWMRVVWIAVVIVCGLTGLSTLSRGGALALATGAFVVVATLMTQHWLISDEPPVRRSRFLTRSLPIGVVALSTVVVVIYTGAEGITQQFSSTSLTELQQPRSKYMAWRSAAELVDETPWVGIGRGALEPALVRVHPASAFATFPYLENEYIQAVVDWGVPGTLLLAFATIWLIVVAVRRWRDGPLVAGAFGAVAAVMLQSNVDFGLELLGIAAPITAVAATLAYVPLREENGQKLAVSRGLRITHAIALVVGALLLVTSPTTTIEEDHRALDRSSLTLDQLRPAIERHPLDYFNYGLAAQAAAKSGDRNAVPLLNHAMTLHPTHPGLHLMAARMLAASGHPAQAVIEYATALPAAPNRAAVIDEIVKRFPVPQAALALGTDAQWIDDIARRLEEMKALDLELAWLTHVLDFSPQSTKACRLLFKLAINQPVLAGKIIGERRCSQQQPSHEERAALGRALVVKKLYEPAMRILDDVADWPERSPEHLEAWLARCDAQMGMEQWLDARSCLRKLDATGLVTPEREAELANRLEIISQH
ncbi:MAG TPA: O-antigen ligase family protein [Kofleriaceae bacterium]